MRLLLDTHTLIWWWLDLDKLPRPTRTLIASNEAIVSAVAIWEIVSKERLGKFPEATPILAELWDLIERDRFKPLSISLLHAERAAGYRLPHGDPFDRLLAAQAELDGLVLVTHDRAFRDFPCATRW